MISRFDPAISFPSRSQQPARYEVRERCIAMLRTIHLDHMLYMLARALLVTRVGASVLHVPSSSRTRITRARA